MFSIVSSRISSFFANRFSRKQAASDVINAMALARGITREDVVLELAQAAANTATAKLNEQQCAAKMRTNAIGYEAQVVEAAEAIHARIVAEADAALAAVIAQSEQKLTKVEEVAQQRDAKAATLDRQLSTINLALDIV